MEGPPLGLGGEDITWPDQVAPRGRKASSTRKIKPQTSNLSTQPIGQGRQSSSSSDGREGMCGKGHPPSHLLFNGTRDFFSSIQLMACARCNAIRLCRYL